MTSTVIQNVIRCVPRITWSTLRQCSSSSRHAREENSSHKTTHFGYETVSEDEKAERVHRVFENVASKYDLMNDLMSGGIHRLWKDVFMSRLRPSPTTRLLDVAGGTGDIVFRFIQHVNQSVGGSTVADDTTQHSSHIHPYDITVCDISENMLKVGQQRAEAQGYQGIHWVCGDAQDLPFEDDLFDCYTIVFGIRNVVDVEQALSEAYRVLKPGGRFMCLEFSQVKNSSLRWVYDQYSFNVIPPLGQVIAGDWKSYQYLVESIRRFPDQESFKEMIEAAGFRCVKYENLTFGVVAIHSGFKI